MLNFLHRKRRRRLRESFFPPQWLRYVQDNFPLYQRLSVADQQELLGHIQVFLAEKNFEGCGGLELTDEIRVSIAAQACLLLLHRQTDYYPKVVSILVYPRSYVARTVKRDAAGFVSEELTARRGEAWSHGAVVLSWDDVRRGAADIHDGHNVVLHEFAHQLDQESGAAEGLPLLERRSMYVAWARILGAAFHELQRDVQQGRSTVMDAYGATNPAEFFAVATESFFEKPAQLKQKHPDLYAELAEYYQQDPLSFFAENPQD
jgi:Mlc titration factor MtfA (ptsG expression regulator)